MEDEWRVMCQWLRGVKVPFGFSSNIKSLVSMKDLTMTNYNSHDCNDMLTVFSNCDKGHWSRVSEDGDHTDVLLL